jgi:hypothetical protein
MNTRRLAAVFTLAVLAAIVLGYTYTSIVGVFNVEVKVNVPPGTEPVKIVLEVNTSKGSRTYEDVARIVVSEDTGVVFKLLNSEARGDFSIAVSGQAILKGENGSYTINMPCLYVKDTTCYRIDMIIPGYDQPLHLPKGEYNVTLTLNWADAKGEGTLVLEIAAVQEAPTTPS